MIRMKGKAVVKTVKVIEYFANNKRSASVMELARKLDVAQSTMSETLNVLVDIGILARDLPSRTYSATPRLAALGLASQPKHIANGRLFKIMSDCANDLGTPVGLFGICNLHAQIYQITSPRDATISIGRFPVILGEKIPLHSSVIGHVLMAALGAESYEKLLWRLKAEAKESETFTYGTLCSEVEKTESKEWAFGSAGVGDGWRATATLLPSSLSKHPLALAALHKDTRVEYAGMLIDKLRSSIGRIIAVDESAE